MTPNEDDRNELDGVDVDDTSRCPRATACENCGSTTDLRVWTAGAKTLGVFCLTLCEPCERAPRPPSPPLAKLERVGAHSVHMGSTHDDMAALL